MRMKIHARFFAQAREMAQKNEEEVELNDGATVSGLIEILKSRVPTLRSVEFKVAVHSEYVDNDHELSDGDEVAIIPPISGG